MSMEIILKNYPFQAPEHFLITDLTLYVNSLSYVVDSTSIARFHRSILMVDLSNIVTRFYLPIFARVLTQLRIKFTVLCF